MFVMAFHVMAMVIEKLKGQNYNSALSKTDFGDVYKLSIQVLVTSTIFSMII